MFLAGPFTGSGHEVELVAAAVNTVEAALKAVQAHDVVSELMKVVLASARGATLGKVEERRIGAAERPASLYGLHRLKPTLALSSILTGIDEIDWSLDDLN